MKKTQRSKAALIKSDVYSRIKNILEEARSIFDALRQELSRTHYAVFGNSDSLRTAKTIDELI